MRESPHEPWRRCEGGNPVPAKTQMSSSHLLYQDCAQGETETDPALRKLESGGETDKEGGNCDLMAGASAAILAPGGKSALITLKMSGKQKPGV